jgi:ribonuclease P protein component
LKSSRIAELLKTRPATNGCWALYLGVAVNQQNPELGLAISKRLAKRAVDRNKLKRLSRELIKSPAFGSKGDCVIKLRKAIGKNTHGKLRKHEQNTLRERLMELANAAD